MQVLASATISNIKGSGLRARAKLVDWNGNKKSEDSETKIVSSSVRLDVKVTEDFSPRDAVNTFLRIEILSTETKEEEGKVEENVVVASTSIDLGSAAVNPEKQLDRDVQVRLRSPENLVEEMTVSLSLSEKIKSSLRRTRLLELQSLVLESVPETWSKEERFTLCFPQLSRKIGDDMVSTIDEDGHLAWQPMSYPFDICTFGDVPLNLDSVPASRSYITDEDAIALRGHLKGGQNLTIHIERQRFDEEQKEWKSLPSATLEVDAQTLLHPGVAATSCATEMKFKNDKESDFTAFVSIRFSHPLLGNVPKVSRPPKRTLSVSSVLKRRGPRPRLPKVFQKSKCDNFDVHDKQSAEVQSIRDAALEAEMFQHFKLAETFHERVVSRAPNCASAWESFGAFKGRRGKRDDAMACFDMALSVSGKKKPCVSASLRKAAFLIDRNEIEFAVRFLSIFFFFSLFLSFCIRTSTHTNTHTVQIRVLSNVRVDEDGHDDLTHDEGAITNALYALCLRKDPSARRKAERAAADRLKRQQQKQIDLSSKQKKKEEEEEEKKGEEKQPDKDICRLLPRTAALFGAMIPSANQHIQNEDVQNVYAQLVKWLQNQRLVQAAEMAIRSYIDGLGEDSENKDRSELRILKARQYMIGNELKHAKSEANTVFESNKEDSPLRAAAALVLANILRRINENREEEMNMLDIATQNRGCEKHDGEISIGDCVEMPRLLRSRLQTGRIKLFIESEDAHVEAENIFCDITNQMSNFNMCKVLRAQALIRLGDIESAESILCDVSEKSSQYPGTYAAMASLSLASSPPQVKTAAQYVEMAVMRGLRSISTMLLLANSFVKHGDDDTAKILLRRIMSNDKVWCDEAIKLWKDIKARTVAKK
jgi:hypothetical protein